MKRPAYRFWLGGILLLAGLQPAGASVWSDVTYIESIQTSDGEPVVRLRVYTSGTSGAWADPAGCGNTAYIDIPLDGQAANAQELINGVYFAMLNHHHLKLEIRDNACSTVGSSIRILTGIHVLDSRHHVPSWPVGDKN
jgi:hypothetical protein